ncbi:MgtC/SapB family protein [Luteibacter yeojuensis]|uniref:MgtC/SapB family protein n=1 Tax=Luteibacter yeojuensis TaxID=345309 RepID=A0A7X5QSK8_9GAMM|nr:DUF4010 domain-containing protein [Luteibacter yeojuensis]NID14619.1 MgtC/SapB family protein [Luteibacter yeojuensis]
MPSDIGILSIAPHVTALGVGLGVGLLIGLERERAKGRHPSAAPAGVRTFSMLGLAGVVAALIGTTAIGVAGFFLALVVTAGYLRNRGDGSAPGGNGTPPGLTTEVAMLTTFLLGVLAASSTVLAAGLGVVVATILASRARLHRFARQWLSERELHDLLILAVSAFVVLPLLPDVTVDPWDSINPRRLWWLVVAVMSIASAGYLVLRTFGARFGLAIAGLAGGFASSTATVLAMGERAREDPSLTTIAAGAAILANVGSLAQMAVVVGSLAPDLLSRLAYPLLAAGLTAACWAAVAAWRADATAVPTRLAGSRPFRPGSVLQFVFVLAGVLLLTAIVRAWLGSGSLPWLMVPSGIADIHAAAAAAAQGVASGQIDPTLAAACVLIAYASSAAFKCVLAYAKGGKTYALRVAPGTLAVLAAFAATLWWTMK